MNDQPHYAIMRTDATGPPTVAEKSIKSVCPPPSATAKPATSNLAIVSQIRTIIFSYNEPYIR